MGMVERTLVRLRACALRAQALPSRRKKGKLHKWGMVEHAPPGHWIHYRVRLNVAFFETRRSMCGFADVTGFELKADVGHGGTNIRTVKSLRASRSVPPVSEDEGEAA